MTAPDLHDLAGEYVLGTLGAEERRRVERALPGDAALRAAVEYWEQRLLPLASLADPLEPAADLWNRIERRIEPAAARTKAPRTPWWERLDVWRSLAAAGFAAAAITAGVLVSRVDDAKAPDYVVVLASPENARPGWVLKMVDDRTLRLEPLARTEVPQARALQLWTKADHWKGPVSLGLVKPGQAVDVKLDKLPPVEPNQLFEITLEPAAGSPIGRPTGPILYIGRAVRVI